MLFLGADGCIVSKRVTAGNLFYCLALFEHVQVFWARRLRELLVQKVDSQDCIGSKFRIRFSAPLNNEVDRRFEF